jgi:hypothetical protein
MMTKQPVFPLVDTPDVDLEQAGGTNMAGGETFATAERIHRCATGRTLAAIVARSAQAAWHGEPFPTCVRGRMAPPGHAGLRPASTPYTNCREPDRQRRS